MGTTTAGPDLADRVLAGDVRAIARAISVVEDETDASARLVSRLFPHTGKAYLIGVTGPPGAGKSTLVDRFTMQLREAGGTVGIVAVDPTSPFTGGAILGDRVRMQSHAADPGVFIRSMATRGNLGGLARATSDAAIILDAAGRDVVIIETVGVGQDEVDIVRTADVSIVVLVPGTGDEVQALKAGIMEIADIFVVNKADREGADRTVAGVEAMLSLQSNTPGEWRPLILKTEATTGAGVPALVQAVDRFRRHAPERLGSRRRARSESRLRELLAARFMARVDTDVGPAALAAIVDRISARTLDPYSAARDIMERLAQATPAGPPDGAPHALRNDG
jgi:LAO/AO transport system kinase